MKKSMLFLLTILFVGALSLPTNAASANEMELGSMNLVSDNDYDLDEEYAAEVIDYKSEPISAYSTSATKTVEYGRQYRIYKKSNKATIVQWTLKGVFSYDGKTSQCKQTSMTCNNNASSTFTVKSKSHYASGIYAVANCKAVNNKTEKIYSKTLRFGVTATGKVVE